MIELRTESSIDVQRDRLVLVNADNIHGVRNASCTRTSAFAVRRRRGHFYASGGFKVLIGR